MIFKNKNYKNSSIFGDKPHVVTPGKIDISILEGFFRKQSQVKVDEANYDMLSKKILKTHTSQDLNNPGEKFIGKSSCRSIFKKESEVKQVPALPAKRPTSDFLPNIKTNIPKNILDSLSSPKSNFINASEKLGSHGSVRTDRISIFDKEVFSRLSDKEKKVISPKVEEVKKTSSAFKVSDIVDSFWSKISGKTSEKPKMQREKIVDKMFGEINEKF